MSGLRGRELQSVLDCRKTRMSRLSDAGLLDVFLASRKASLAQGCSVIEANERAHIAVESRINRAPAPILVDPGSPQDIPQ
jgi:hypothetical protein